MIILFKCLFTKYLYKCLTMPALNRSFAGNSKAPV